jgi:hypothetical protein
MGTIATKNGTPLYGIDLGARRPVVSAIPPAMAVAATEPGVFSARC